MAGTIIDQWFAAASVGENYKTMHVWDGDGNAARVFELNFQGGYINQADVKSFMVNKTTQARTDLTVRFTGTNTVTLSQAVPATHRVTIYRDTNKTAPLAAFADGAIITALNLDRNAKQAVFAVAEMVDRFDSVTATAQDAIATAYSALDKANTAINTANAATTTANGAKTAAAGAVADAKAAVQTANTATSTANAAKATAEGIDAKVNQAVATSNAANSTAGQAKATAEGIDAKATQAQSDAAKAKTDAASALSTANGVDAKASTALSNSSTALDKAQSALDSVNGATANFDRLWKAVKTVNSVDNSVEWKGNQLAPYWGIRNVDGVTTYAFRDVNGSLQLDYNGNSAKYVNMLGLNVQVSRLRAIGGSVAAVTGDNAREINFGFTNDASRVDWNYTNGVQAMNFNSLYLTTNGGYHASGNQNSNKARQGMHMVWNEEGDGRGSIVVNRGGGTGGLNMRFVDASNSVETGSVRISGSADLVTTGNITGGHFVARGNVSAGNGGGQLGQDGNVYGGVWGGYLNNWLAANCMSDMGRGGQQFRPGAMQSAWESPPGCFLTGTNTNYTDGRIHGSYFRQLIGRKINGGQFGIGDFA